MWYTILIHFLTPNAMFHQIEQKVDDAMLSFVIVGLLSLLLGVLVITNEYLLRFMVGAFFFVFAYLTFHIAYKIKCIKMVVKEKMPFMHYDEAPAKKRKK